MGEKVKFSFDEFEEIVLIPIRAAYREPMFLKGSEESYAHIWYDVLKRYDKEVITDVVDSYIQNHENLPVLANLCKGAEWKAYREE